MKISGLKNYTLLEVTHGISASRKLLDEDGQEYWPFSVYMDWLHSRDVAANTRISYAVDIAYFLDYLTEAGHALADGDVKWDPLFLVNTISKWPDFMEAAPEQRKTSKDPLIKSLGVRLRHSKLASASVSRRIAALKGFANLSDRFQQILKDHRDCGLLGDDPTHIEEKLLPELNTRRKVTPRERRGMIRNSMLGGVISRGPQLINNTILKRSRRRAPTGSARLKTIFEIDPLQKAIPCDRIIELIDAAKSYRDKSYLSLLAACGARGSEARQVMWQDIDPIKRTVMIVPPWDRRGTSAWDVLPAMIQADIPWKGRTTALTFLLEPYATMFFEYLLRYRETSNEWNETVDHGFVFCKARKFGFEPLLRAKPSSIAEIFTKARDRLNNLPHYTYPAHSLRHSYGLFLKNQIPLDNGKVGLDLAIVRDLIGHSSITSTEVYAPTDITKVMEVLKKANDQILGNLVNQQRLVSEIEKYRVQVSSADKKRLLEKQEAKDWSDDD